MAWTAASGATSYTWTLYQQASNVSTYSGSLVSAGSGSVSAPTVSASFGGLVIGSNYYYTVYASNASGTSPVASSPIVQYIPNPYNLTLAVTSSNATLSWSSTGTSPTFYYTLTQTTAYSYTSGTTTTIANSNTTASSVTATFTPVSGNFYYYSIYEVTSVGTSPVYLSPITQYATTVAFSPTSVSGTQLWLDASFASSVAVTGGTTVVTWTDRSANARVLGVGSGTTTYASQAVTLSNSYLYVNSAVNLTNVAVFTVFKTNTNTNNQAFIAGKPSGSGLSYSSPDGFGIYANPGVQTLQLYGTASSGIILSSTPTNTPCLVTWQQTSNSVANGYYNGGVQSATTNPGNTRTGTALGFAVGAEWGGSSYGNLAVTASVNEILVYNTALSTPERQTIEGYLAWKWGIQASLPGSHPYSSNAPSLSTPTSPTLSITSGTATLGWTAASGATAYNWVLYMSSNSNFNGTSNSSGSTTSNAPTSAPTGLTSGKFWYFTVASSNVSGVSSAIASSIVSY
jgi:hypothetical protein